MNHPQTPGEFCSAIGCWCQENVPLSRFTTFKIGGPADWLAQPADQQQLAGLLVFARRRQLPVAVLGNGSNVLAPDEGFRGLVIVLGSRFSRMEQVGEHQVFAQAGATLSQLASFAAGRGLGGLVFAYGIPGSVGGAVYMNAGAYGGEISQVLQQSCHLSPEGQPGSYRLEELEMGYRTSRYQREQLVVTGALFSLQPEDPALLRSQMQQLFARRAQKQPLELPSAGSMFKRPAGAYAAALIDQCGLKGAAVGGAQVSPKHAGFIVNRGGATCRDVLTLVEQVQNEVRRQTGYELVREVRLLKPAPGEGEGWKFFF